jgi:hypothetical protein
MASAMPQSQPGPSWADPSGNMSSQQQGMGAMNSADTQQMQDEFFAPLSTLDEPVRETIMRDVRAVGSKLKVVLLPMDRTVRHLLCIFR